MKYSTMVKVNGRNIYVKFESSPVFGKMTDSTFSTSDEEVAEALKKHPRYKDVFVLKKGTATANSGNANADTENDDKVDLTALLSDKDNAVNAEAVTSANTAKAWLQAEQGKTFDATKALDIKKEAAGKYNTLFPNWN